LLQWFRYALPKILLEKEIAWEFFVGKNHSCNEILSHTEGAI